MARKYKAEKGAREKAKQEAIDRRVKEEQARRDEEQARDATMSAAKIDAVVVGQGAESAEKRARVRADVEKTNNKRKRQWSVEKEKKKRARASPAHARRTRKTPRRRSDWL